MTFSLEDLHVHTRGERERAKAPVARGLHFRGITTILYSPADAALARIVMATPRGAHSYACVYRLGCRVAARSEGREPKLLEGDPCAMCTGRAESTYRAAAEPMMELLCVCMRGMRAWGVPNFNATLDSVTLPPSLPRV